jgi:hypothetical protein
MNITKRYVHPQHQTVRKAIERADSYNPATAVSVGADTRLDKTKAID